MTKISDLAEKSNKQCAQNAQIIRTDCAENVLFSFSLGNITSYSAKPINREIQTQADKNLAVKYDYRKRNIIRKKEIGKFVPRVSNCGVRPIKKDEKYIDAVQGEKGGIFYRGVQRCGCVWFCPDCMYKLMKVRADELYSQLKKYNEAGKVVLFVTFTLQHIREDSLGDLHGKLLGTFNFANSHRTWIKEKKNLPVEYLRTFEILYGMNGWHPHLHSVFVGDPGIEESIKVFENLYKQELIRLGFIVNKHTIITEKWNGRLEKMEDYLFKGMLERELTSGSMKSGKGKTFFDLVDEGNQGAITEYVEVMKGKRQYHHSRGFFKDVWVKSDEEIIKDDKVHQVLFTIPMDIYKDICSKGIALDLLNEYLYKGKDKSIEFLELYDVDASFLDSG